MDLSARLQRAAIAFAIVAAHAALLYAASALRPVIGARLNKAPIAMRFVESVEPAQEWTPPPAPPINLPVDVREPLAPQIEIPVETEITPNQISARAIPPVTPQPSAAQDAPKLIAAVEYVREPIPRYPPQSRRLREQGLVVLRVLIDEKGQASSIEVESSSGHARLDHAAKEAVARAAFRPYIEDGAPRRALVLIPIEFALNSSSA
jgi:protein TonB